MENKEQELEDEIQEANKEHNELYGIDCEDIGTNLKRAELKGYKEAKSQTLKQVREIIELKYDYKTNMYEKFTAKEVLDYLNKELDKIK